MSSNTPVEVARPRGRPKLLPDSEQAARIVAAARILFLKSGYGATTMDDITAYCRISKRTLYRLFPGKTELFAAIIDEHRQAMLALPGDYDHLPLDQAIARIFHIDIDEEADRERWALVQLAVVESRQFPELGRLLRERGSDRSREALARWLERQRITGRIQVEDAMTAAKMLMDIMFGAVALKESHAPDWPSEDHRQLYLRRCIAMFVNGIRPR